MTIQEALKNYTEHPRFRELTNYIKGLILSGAFTGEEMTQVTLLAVEMAEIELKKISGSAGNPIVGEAPTKTDAPKCKPKPNSGEKHHAIYLANEVLNRVNADPDDDLAVLARQFQRAMEVVQRQEKALQEVDWQGKAESDLISSNQEQIVRTYRNGMNLIRSHIEKQGQSLSLTYIMGVIGALSSYHPLSEQWAGFPKEQGS